MVPTYAFSKKKKKKKNWKVEILANILIIAMWI